MSRIVLVTQDGTFGSRVSSAFHHSLNGDVRAWPYRVDRTTPAEVVAATVSDDHKPTEVVALGPGIPVDEALEIARRFDRERPEVSVVLVAEPSAYLLEEALRAGVRDLLKPDADTAVMRQTFERALQTASRRRENLAIMAEPEASRARIITVVSPKGGSGKTTVASNLATTLAQRLPGEVVLVDLDLQFGDIASSLQIVPEASMSDAAKATDLDTTALKVFLTPHASTLFTLCAPDSPVESEEISPQLVVKLLHLLADEFSYVIVDTSAGLTEHTLAALEMATDILFVCSMDVPSVRSLRKEVVTLDQLGMSTQRRHFVLNRADARVGLATDDIEATVGLPVDVSVPSSRLVPLSLNEGVPVVIGEPRSPVARSIGELADRFAGVRQPSGAGLFRRRKEAQ